MNLDTFNVPITIRVKQIYLSLNDYGHGLDDGVGSCNYTVAENS